MISKNIINKANTIVVIEKDETPDVKYFECLRTAKDGLHKYSVDYHKDNSIPLNKRIKCNCTWHVLHPSEDKACSYTVAVVQKLVELGILKKELLEFL